MRTSKTICVIIPHGGSLEMLDEQLDALSKQTLLPSRVIVSCNRVGSYSLLKNHIEHEHYPGLVVQAIDSSSTPGPSSARNAGWKNAVEDYVLFCDDDDIVSKSWVQQMSIGLESSAICAGPLEYSLLNSRRQSNAKNPTMVKSHTKMNHLEHGATANLGVRLEVLRKLQGFDEEAKCAEDIDFCWRGQYVGFNFSFVPGAIVHYRLREGIKSSFKRGFQYGYYDGWLLLRHRQFGARKTFSSSVRQILAIPYSLLKCLLGRSDISDVSHKIGGLLGRVASSIKWKIWVL